MTARPSAREVSRQQSQQRQHSGSVYPCRPEDHQPLRSSPRIPYAPLGGPLPKQQSNGASPRPPSSPQAPSPALSTPDLEDVAVGMVGGGGGGEGLTSQRTHPVRNPPVLPQGQGAPLPEQQINGASPKSPSSPQALSPALPTPDLEDVAVHTAQPVQIQPVYRSMSRYHKKGNVGTGAVGYRTTHKTPPIPARAEGQSRTTPGHSGVGSEGLDEGLRGTRSNGPRNGLHDCSDAQFQHEHQELRQQWVDGAQLPIRAASADNRAMSQGNTPVISEEPQAQAGTSKPSLQSSRSRYRRRQPPVAHDRPPEAIPVVPIRELPDRATPRPPRRYLDNIHSVQQEIRRRAQAQTPPARGLITKASLDRLPDDTQPDKTAVQRRVSDFRAQGADRRQREEKQAEDTQKQIKKLLDTEADRHRRMHARIQAQREREEAARQADEEDKEERLKRTEEEQHERERKLAERERQLEERERKAKHEEDRRAGEASVSRGRRTREEQSKTLDRTDTGSPHKRRESNEDRTQRHRKRSLSALEGKPDHRQKSNEQPPPVPPPPPPPPGPSEPADFKAPLVNFLKKRKPTTDTPNPHRVDRSKSVKKPERSTKDGPATTAPGIDAPISAVNAGERRVLVECNRSSIFLPVTPSSTPVDLIRSAATCLAEDINPKASVLLESFGKIGVQRPLRKYERIRDVINSWDNDEQNSLILIPSAKDEENLDVSSVPSAQPSDFYCQLYYSTKPGKWDKKWVTLRSDGQVLYAKSQGHTDPKDVTTICHMTDFDIYTPDHSSRGKKIRPPKKLCFAIKSQQKSNMFMSLDNFAHFFSTSDKRLASEWYQAIHGWRSWYLVNVMGEGQMIEQRKPDSSNADGAPLLPEMGRTHRAQGSRDSHYQLGSFKPLLNLEMFATNGEQGAAESGNLVSHARDKSLGGPPSAFPKWLIDNIDSGQPSDPLHNLGSSREKVTLDRSGTLKHNASIKRTISHRRKPSDPATSDPKLNANINPEDSTFAAGGLLGRSYSTRPKRESLDKGGPFFTGGLLDTIGSSSNVTGFNNPPLPPSGSAYLANVDSSRPKTADTSLSRTKSRHHDQGRQRPLLDLHNNSYTESPQHNRKGHGVIPDSIGTGGLVDLATSPERPAGAGPADLHARPTTRDETHLSRSKSRHHNHDRQTSPEMDKPFNPTGLISTTDARASKNFWNPNTSVHGRGVMDGSKVKGNGPMLDIKEESTFAQGSLLRKVEMEGERPSTATATAPIIDRGKEREIVVGTGEGLS